MSVFVGVRLPDELARLVDEEACNRGKNRSQIIIEAISEHQRRGGVVLPPMVEEESTIEKDEVLVEVEPEPEPEPEKEVIEKPAIVPKRKREKPGPKLVENPKESAREPEVLAVSGGCGKHPGSGWAKVGGWWCSECGRVV